MKHLKYLLFIITLFAGFCLWLQIHTFINSNILWLMHVGDKMLAGGKYYRDFIEVNPPMGVYIYLPAVILNYLFHIGYIPSIIIYLFLLAITSWICCAFLLRKIFATKSVLILYSLEFALAFSYFILPAFSFGEREYLLVVLMMPYLFLVVLRLAQQPFNAVVGSIIGIEQQFFCKF